MGGWMAYLQGLQDKGGVRVTWEGARIMGQ